MPTFSVVAWGWGGVRRWEDLGGGVDGWKGVLLAWRMSREGERKSWVQGGAAGDLGAPCGGSGSL